MKNKTKMTKWLHEISFSGNLVELEPLNILHLDGLTEAVQDGNIWELWYTSAPSIQNAESYILKAIQEYDEDVSLPFAIIDKKTKKVVGTTRYMNAVAKNRRLEIGTTWYAKSAQKTGINTECKYLLLSYAFEDLQCIAVEFRTHFHNVDSRNAIARLGAKQDGILRNHSIDNTGHLRDTVVFSILDSEWKTVKKSLEFKMTRKYER